MSALLARRTVLSGGLGAALSLTTTTAAQWGDPPTPAAGDPDAPAWPGRERLPLWPRTPARTKPGLPRPNPTMNGPKSTRELWIRGVAQPEISVFRPARPDGTSVLALPGGGYEFLSVQNEGLDVAQRFNATRTTVFVLSYRLPREGWRNPHLAPLQDAQRAIRLIRRNAEMLDVVPDQVGVLGFSAGGHLAADLATSFNETTYRRVDEADRLSARPAFAGLIYPVIHIAGGSGRNLLGHNPAPAMVAGRSPLLKLGAATPPTFLVHAFDDGLVPIENSLDWIVAARAKQLPVDAHLFASGGHGFGLHLPEAAPGSKWPELFNLWMRKSAA